MIKPALSWRAELIDERMTGLAKHDALTCGSMPSCSIIGPKTMPPPTPIKPAITPATAVRARASA